jgi:hypothetical protein
MPKADVNKELAAGFQEDLESDLVHHLAYNGDFGYISI